MKTFIQNLGLFFILAVIAHSANGQSTTQHSIKFDPKNTLNATVVGESGMIKSTTDGGVTWTIQSSGTSGTLYSNIIIDVNTEVAVGEGGLILKTIDGGNTWNTIAPKSSDNLRDIEMITSTSLLICGDNGAILTSSDAGDTWTLQYYSGGNTLSDSYFPNKLTGYIAGSSGLLLKTTDGGATWTQIQSQNPSHHMGTVNLNGISGFDENNFTIIGDGSAIRRTTDGGLTWTNIPTEIGTKNLNDIIFFNSTEGVIAGAEGTTLKTTDGGLSWNVSNIEVSSSALLASPQFMGLNSVAFSSINSGIIVGTTGTCIYSTDGGNTWTDVPQAPNRSLRPGVNKDNKVTLNQNYPNPFNPSTKISYILPFSSSVTLKIYDMLGREVKTLVNDVQTAGNYNYSFDASNLSSGIYFYVLKASNGANQIAKTMRMILTK